MIALSHSRLSDFNNCPRKFRLKYLDKAPNFQIDDDNKSAALVHGNKVHKYLEDYVNDLKDNPQEEIPPSSIPDVANGREFADQLISQYGIENTVAEMKLAIDKDWQPVEWFSKDAYYRAIVDLTLFGDDKIQMIDWKTGKFRDYTPPSGFGQLELSAGFMFALKSVSIVETAYAYVGHRKIITKTHRKEQLIPIKNYFDMKHDQVNSEDEWLPTRNQFCRWCDATTEQCPFAPNK